MSPFLWFAIALTVGYVIYYTVMIMNDLYGKKPDDKDTTEEIEPAFDDAYEAESLQQIMLNEGKVDNTPKVEVKRVHDEI